MSPITTGQAPVRRTQQERRDATAAAILAATVDAVVETGPATGLVDIARRAGVTKGALQHHFPEKLDLMVAVVAAGWNDLVDRLDRPPDLSATPEARVRALIDETWNSYRQPICRAAFMISSDPNIGDALAQRLSPGFEVIRARLDTQWTQSFAGLGVPDDRLVLARRFVRSHLLGMLVQRQLPSAEPEPSLELSSLSAATWQMMHAPEES